MNSVQIESKMHAGDVLYVQFKLLKRLVVPKMDND